MSFSDMVVGENGLLIELRCHNSFNEKIYTDITNYLSKHLSEWKSTGFIPIADAVSIFNGRSRRNLLLANPQPLCYHIFVTKIKDSGREGLPCRITDNTGTK